MIHAELIIRNVLESYGDGGFFSDAGTIDVEWSSDDETLWDSFGAAVRAARRGIVEEAVYVLRGGLDDSGNEPDQHTVVGAQAALDEVAVERAILALPLSEIIAAHRAGVAAFTEVMEEDPICFYDDRYSGSRAVRACREASRQYIDNALDARGGIMNFGGLV